MNNVNLGKITINRLGEIIASLKSESDKLSRITAGVYAFHNGEKDENSEKFSEYMDKAVHSLDVGLNCVACAVEELKKYISKQENSLPEVIRHYREYKAKYSDSIILFRCGDFYEAYEEDSEKVADVLRVTLRRIEEVYNCTSFSYHALDTYLPRLIRAGYKVAIYEGEK